MKKKNIVLSVCALIIVIGGIAAVAFNPFLRLALYRGDRLRGEISIEANGESINPQEAFVIYSGRQTLLELKDGKGFSFPGGEKGEYSFCFVVDTKQLSSATGVEISSGSFVTLKYSYYCTEPLSITEMLLNAQLNYDGDSREALLSSQYSEQTRESLEKTTENVEKKVSLTDDGGIDFAELLFGLQDNAD